MTIKTIESKLCYYDKRNPDGHYSFVRDPETIVKPDPCYCDNCFNGRTQLAEELLKMYDETKKLKREFKEKLEIKTDIDKKLTEDGIVYKKLFIYKWVDCIHNWNIMLIKATDKEEADKKFKEIQERNKIYVGAYQSGELNINEFRYIGWDNLT